MTGSGTFQKGRKSGKSLAKRTKRTEKDTPRLSEQESGTASCQNSGLSFLTRSSQHRAELKVTHLR